MHGAGGSSRCCRHSRQCVLLCRTAHNAHSPWKDQQDRDSFSLHRTAEALASCDHAVGSPAHALLRQHLHFLALHCGKPKHKGGSRRATCPAVYNPTNRTISKHGYIKRRSFFLPRRCLFGTPKAECASSAVEAEGASVAVMKRVTVHVTKP